jgi:hypothetical protein
LIEERNQLQKKVTHPYRTQPTATTTKTSANTTVGVLGHPLNLRQNMNPTSNVKRISNQEARERREKGLCYYCDEKFIPFQVIAANDPNYS